MNEGMVELEQKGLVKEIVNECYEIVVFDAAMEDWLNEFVESIVAHEVRGISAQQVTYESVEAFSGDAFEETFAKMVREITEETLQEEQTLTEITEHVGSTIIDSQIREVTTEELEAYKYQVEVSNSIMDFLLLK